MRIKDVKVGMRCWANVSGARVEVEVIRETNHLQLAGRSGRARRARRFEVRRVGGSVLPKLRSAAALHCTDGRSGEWPSMTERQDVPAPTHLHFSADPKDAPRCSKCHGSGEGVQFRILSPHGFGTFCVACEPAR